jgi:hypothetical protein
MINLYSMQFGLLATLGSITIQFALFFTMVIKVRVAKDACLIDSEINEEIHRDQSIIWWCNAIFHFICGIAMSLRELNDTANDNYIFEVGMNLLSLIQIGLLCKTTQTIFVDEENFYSICLADQETNKMPLNYQNF